MLTQTEIKTLLTVLDQLGALDDKYRCKCKNEIFGRHARIVLLSPGLKEAKESLRKELEAFGDMETT